MHTIGKFKFHGIVLHEWALMLMFAVWIQHKMLAQLSLVQTLSRHIGLRWEGMQRWKWANCLQAGEGGQGGKRGFKWGDFGWKLGGQLRGGIRMEGWFSIRNNSVVLFFVTEQLELFRTYKSLFRTIRNWFRNTPNSKFSRIGSQQRPTNC